MLGLQGLNRNVISIDTRIADPGWYSLPGDPRRYRDWILRLRGTGHADDMNLRESIAQSCDVFFYDLAHRLGVIARFVERGDPRRRSGKLRMQFRFG